MTQIFAGAIRCGIHSGQQHGSYDELLELWLSAERLGYDWISLFDHFRPPIGGPAGPCFEGTTMLAALAARTSTIRCAMLVSAVTWRHPAIVAAVAASVDHISAGRLEFGLGAGGPDLAYEQYGLRFPASQVRLDMLDEACEIVRSLWDNELTSFDGRVFRLADAYLMPKPVQRRLPLIVGGEGERRTLLTAARHADIWNSLAGDPVSYERKLTALTRHCAAIGREPADIRKSVTFRAVLAGDRREAAERASQLRLALPADWPWAEYLVIGTPQDCLGKLRPYLDLGVTDFVLGARPPLDWATIEMFAADVAPVLREQVPGG